MHLRCENWSRARSSHGAMRTAVGINWTPSCGLAFAQSSRCPKPDSVDLEPVCAKWLYDLKTADTFNHSRLILSLASSRTVSSGQRGRLAARYDATVAVFHVPAVPTSQWSRRRVPWKAAAVGSCTSPCMEPERRAGGFASVQVVPMTCDHLDRFHVVQQPTTRC